MADNKTNKTENRTEWLTTGQAAKICTVTPDTVLKWIKKGRLDAIRTAGGHYRINRFDLEALLPTPHLLGKPEPPPISCSPRPLRCWEYMSARGELRKECANCVVYRVRAAWCFEVADLEQDIGHARQFCGNVCCQDCAYFRRIRGMATNVLVITANEEFIARLADDENENIALSFARSGYEASAVYRTSTHTGAGEPAPDYVDGMIEKPISTNRIATLIESFPVEIPAAQDGSA
jgi:excisionase family DNA binding protein